MQPAGGRSLCWFTAQTATRATRARRQGVGRAGGEKKQFSARARHTRACQPARMRRARACQVQPTHPRALPATHCCSRNEPTADTSSSFPLPSALRSCPCTRLPPRCLSVTTMSTSMTTPLAACRLRWRSLQCPPAAPSLSQSTRLCPRSAQQGEMRESTTRSSCAGGRRFVCCMQHTVLMPMPAHAPPPP